MINNEILLIDFSKYFFLFKSEISLKLLDNIWNYWLRFEINMFLIKENLLEIGEFAELHSSKASLGNHHSAESRNEKLKSARLDQSQVGEGGFFHNHFVRAGHIYSKERAVDYNWLGPLSKALFSYLTLEIVLYLTHLLCILIHLLLVFEWSPRLWVLKN